MAAKPMLDGIALQQVQEIGGEQREIFNQHHVPALEGDFHQDLGRRAVRIGLNGVLTGPEAANNLATLRTKFRAAAPVAFVADIATATKVTRMLIEEMGVRELAGKPMRYEYALKLVEFIGPAKAKTQASPTPPPAPNLNSGNLRVEAIAGGQPGFNFGRAVVMVEGAEQNNPRISTTLRDWSGHIWAGEGLPPGKYAVRIALTDPPMAGSGAVQVRAGQSAHVTVALRPQATIAHAFVVHFSPGSSFVEPEMFPVLRRAATYAQAHPSEKLLIVGHADAAGDAEDAQSISEERARAVSTCLTYGNSPQYTLAEWHALRQSAYADGHGGWGRREYQLILQALGYFQGQIEGDPHLTSAAVRDFQLDHGLSVDGIIGEATWTALVEDYLNQNGLALPKEQLLRGGWTGLGVQRLARNTRDAWRPNRRVELLFVKSGSRSSNPADWVILPAEPDSILVTGSIRLNDGTPCAGLKYVLTAPDGEYMDGEQPGGPPRGSPIPGNTSANGSFAYLAKPKGIGFYTLEVIGPVVARLGSEPPSAAKGSRVVALLDGSRNFDVIVSRR
jgi:outer membrane protein OmpA-like peptidoglycan-associated protein